MTILEALENLHPVQCDDFQEFKDILRYLDRKGYRWKNDDWLDSRPFEIHPTVCKFPCYIVKYLKEGCNYIARYSKYNPGLKVEHGVKYKESLRFKDLSL